MTALQQLSSFVEQTTFEFIPQEVIERAKWVMRDSFAVIVAGLREPENANLANYAAERHKGSVSLFGHSATLSPEWASLVHGTAGTSLELDEGHAFARGHAAIHAVPTTLALAEAQESSGKETLKAFILGYEVAARMGVATKLRAAVHPFGAWGVLGAAAVGAQFQSFNAEEIEGCLELAASYAINPSFNSAFQGVNVRNTYAGVVNRLGLMAADLYGLGFRGEQGGIETSFGQILGESFDESALTEGLGQRYEIMRGYFKPYSACRYTHGAVELALSLREKLEHPLEGIKSILVETYDIAATLKDTQVSTPLAGRFSLPYVVAACLVLGHANPDAFSESSLNSPLIQALAQKVTVKEDKAFTALTPQKRPSRITLKLKSGTELSESVYGSKGDPDQPMSKQELQDKFKGLLEPSFSESQMAEIWQSFDDLDRYSSVKELTTQLIKQEASMA